MSGPPIVGTPGALPAVPSQAAHLGQGIAYPVRADSKGRLALSWGLTAVSESMASICSTEPGERCMQPDYGAATATFEPQDSHRIRAAIEETVADHEPRVTGLGDIEPRNGQTMETVEVDIPYSVVNEATSQTLVYPFFARPNTDG